MLTTAVTNLAFWGILIHLVVDWLFQNDWMAANKANPKHPAGYVHAGLHALALLLIFPPQWALAIGITHWIIDLRFMLKAWREFFGQTVATPSDPVMKQAIAMDVAIWGDQVVHFIIIAAAAILAARGMN